MPVRIRSWVWRWFASLTVVQPWRSRSTANRRVGRLSRQSSTSPSSARPWSRYLHSAFQRESVPRIAPAASDFFDIGRCELEALRPEPKCKRIQSTTYNQFFAQYMCCNVASWRLIAIHRGGRDSTRESAATTRLQGTLRDDAMWRLLSRSTSVVVTLVPTRVRGNRPLCSREHPDRYGGACFARPRKARGCRDDLRAGRCRGSILGQYGKREVRRGAGGRRSERPRDRVE
jgi:hypothetical protein